MGGPTNNLQSTIAVTPTSVVPDRPKASLSKEGFDTLVRQKGYPIYIDKTVKCPCSETISHQALPGCRNCGGSGYVVYNRRETFGIIHSMNKETVFKEWSEIGLGTASMTTYHEIGLSYMDKVTLKEGETIHNELVHLTQFPEDNIWRVGLRYKPLNIQAIFLFQGENVQLKTLTIDTDYVIENSQVIVLVDETLIQGLTKPTLSIRYSHRPEFLVVDIPRKTINSLSRNPKTKKDQHLYYPINAILKVSHYVINVDSNNGQYLLDNSFTESCEKSSCEE